MNILLINHYAGSPAHGMEYRPFFMAREWVRAGHQVTVVAASQAHVRAHQPPHQEEWTVEQIEGIHYLWIPTPAYSGNGLGRIRNMLSFVRQLYSGAAELVERWEPEVVIASSTYPLDMIPARRIADLASAELAFEVHDLWPLSPMELGGMSPWHPFILVMQWAEDYAYSRADKVVSMLPTAKEHMLSRGMAPEKYYHVPNGICVEDWGGESEPLPQEHQQRLDALASEGKFLVGYAGAHGLANALDCLVGAARELPEDVAVVLIGKGPEKERLQARVAEEGISGVHFLPAITRESVPAFLERMDAVFIGLQRQPLFRFGVSPNKLMDYMMSGTPVVYAIDAGNDLVAEAGCGVSVEAEDEGAIRRGILELRDMGPEERRELGAAGKRFMLENHDYRVLAERLLESVRPS